MLANVLETSLRWPPQEGRPRRYAAIIQKVTCLASPCFCSSLYTSCLYACVQGRTCSMKRVIIPEQPVPASLADLQRHALSSSSSSSSSYAGPVSSLAAGDYVAVLVQQLGGTSTLLSKPLARTSIQEFVAVFGSTTPGLAPGWLGDG